MLKEAKIRDEAELESILVAEPDQIEENFLVLTHQRKAYGLKSMDILGVDSENTLTVVELKVTPDVNQLRQTIQYYDWILQQGIDWISDAYKDRLTDRKIEERMPQIFLIAPDFNEETLTEAKYMREDIKVRCFKYLALDINNKKHIKLIEVQVPPVKEIETKPWTVGDNINYIAKEEIGILFSQLADNIRQLDSKVEEKPGNWRIGYWVSGRKFCELYPKKEYYNVGFKTGGEDQRWDTITDINTHTLSEEAFAHIKNAYDLMKRR
jgi:hypothetical protein